MGRPPTPENERFWSKIKKTAKCWEYTGATQFGYGIFTRADRSTIKAHRFSWILHYGEIPDGLQICHKCDNRSCVRPKHLFKGTQSDNMQDASRKGRCANNFTKRSGEKINTAKLTAANVLEIRRLYPSIDQTELARRFGVSDGNISHIVTRRTWRHLPQ